jgi:hypothetical protein
MKILLTLALLAGLGFSPNNDAEKNINELIKVKAQDQRMKVILPEGMGRVDVNILAADGRFIHNSRVNADRNVIVPFDLSQLPDGEYKIKIKQRDGSEQRIIHQVVKEVKTPKEFPLVAYSKKLDDSSFQLTVVGLEKPGVKVEISDSFGKRLFNQVVDHPEAFSKIYRMKNKSLEGLVVRVTDQDGRSRSFLL